MFLRGIYVGVIIGIFIAKRFIIATTQACWRLNYINILIKFINIKDCQVILNCLELYTTT